MARLARCACLLVVGALAPAESFAGQARIASRVQRAVDGACTTTEPTWFVIKVEVRADRDDGPGTDAIHSYLVDGANRIIDRDGGRTSLPLESVASVTVQLRSHYFNPVGGPFTIYLRDSLSVDGDPQLKAGEQYINSPRDLDRLTFDPSILDSDCPAAPD